MPTTPQAPRTTIPARRLTTRPIRPRQAPARTLTGEQALHRLDDDGSPVAAADHAEATDSAVKPARLTRDDERELGGEG